MATRQAARRRKLRGLLQIRTRHPWAAAIQAQNLSRSGGLPAPRAQEKRQFVDLQNDVTVADLRQAIAEGFVHIEHAKRYTTLGVGTDQGRFSSVLGAAIIGELSGQSLSEVGVFRTRPPYQPVTLIALTGHRFASNLQPTQRTALHAWHEAQWRRARGSRPVAAVALLPGQR